MTGGGGVEIDAQAPATVEERLEAAERRIEALDRDVKVFGFLLLGLVVAAAVVALLNELVFSHPAPTNRDATEDELLTAGMHCYDSPEERASARQRALAAIERMQWEREMRSQPQGDGQMWGTAPAGPNEIPSIWDSPESVKSIDADADSALCFSVQYLP